MKKLKLLTLGLSTGLFITCGILNAMQEQQNRYYEDKDKQLAIISTTNKDRRVMLYDPNIEKEKTTNTKESVNPEQKTEKEKNESIKPKPTRPGRTGRAPKEKLQKVTESKKSSIDKIDKPIEEKTEEQQIRTIYSDIKEGKYKLKKTGNLEKLLQRESIARPIEERVDPLIFYTSSKYNMEMLFNKLNNALASSSEPSINANFEEIMSILSSAALEIRKINKGEKSNLKKPRLEALIRYAWQKHPSDVTYDLKEKMRKLENLNINFNAPIFDKDTFK